MLYFIEPDEKKLFGKPVVDARDDKAGNSRKMKRPDMVSRLGERHTATSRFGGRDTTASHIGGRDTMTSRLGRRDTTTSSKKDDHGNVVMESS